MIKFTIEKEKFLDILQNTAFLLIRKNSSNILQNILIQLNQKNLFLTICNLETEFIIKTSVLYSTGTGKITVSGKKLLNICRTLPNSSIITIETVLHHKLKITTNNSYFELLTQPANDFPNLISFKKKIDFSISEKQLKTMIEQIRFCMAKDDVRYYLNGMFLELTPKHIRTVATDGHRLAMSTTLLNECMSTLLCSIIISKQGILELLRLLTKSKNLIKVLISNNTFRICTKKFLFTTKLIDGTFPNYKNVLLEKVDVVLKINVSKLKQVLLRVALLSDKQFRGVEFDINQKFLTLKTSNEVEEIARETIKINFQKLKIKFTLNIDYILDILNIIQKDSIYLSFKNPISTIQIQDNINSNELFIIMPLKF